MMQISPPDSTDLDFDVDALRARYAEERQRRLRADGLDQFVELGAVHSSLAVDPFAHPDQNRQRVDEEVDALILGGGLIGLSTAVRLQQAGIESFRIVEQGAEFGGAWYWNQYPGVRCDIESYVYIPLLEETGTVPSEKYASGREILDHCRRMATIFGLWDKGLFQTEIKQATWDEESARWLVRTNRGDLFRTRFLMVSSGPLHRPKLPNIPGIADFEGHAFHTSRWDYAYTGGTTEGGLVGLKSKRVALIGTGATGIQVLPHLPQHAEQILVFQRTPSTVGRRDNRPTNMDWYRAQEPGWQQRRMDNFMLTMLGVKQSEDMVADAWTDAIELVSGLPDDAVLPEGMSAQQFIQLTDYRLMTSLRRRVEDLVENPVTAEKLKPWYNYMCKRPGFSDEYLQAFNAPNVTLVDTRGRGIDRITRNAIEFDGQRYPVDCIIFATGFQANRYSYESGGYEVVGAHGVSLREKWANGVRTVHGTKVSGFPNFHIIGTLNQAAVAWNYTYVAVRQGEHAAHFVAQCLKENVRSVDVREEATLAWLDELERTKIDMSDFYQNCTPSYLNNEGDIETRPAMYQNLYHGGPIKYLDMMSRWYAHDYRTDCIFSYN